MSVDQFEKAMRRLNEIYAEYKLGPDAYWHAPEARPAIGSDQVKALLSLLIENGFCASFSPTAPDKV